MAKEADLAAMDKAAEEAKKELDSFPPEHVASVAAWWKRNYTKAGHKRLGRLLVEYDK